jgi:riboflavin kinase/FMN adenylyltransferase
MKPTVISGIVQKGKRLGRTLGFPTANLAIPREVDLPANGVYIGIVTLSDGTRHRCILNQGHHPTLPGGGASIEAHLFDFSGDLYGARITVEYLHKLRPERKFPSVDALIKQIGKDAEAAKRWFLKHDIKI